MKIVGYNTQWCRFQSYLSQCIIYFGSSVPFMQMLADSKKTNNSNFVLNLIFSYFHNFTVATARVDAKIVDENLISNSWCFAQNKYYMWWYLVRIYWYQWEIGWINLQISLNQMMQQDDIAMHESQITINVTFLHQVSNWNAVVLSFSQHSVVQTSSYISANI